MQLNVVYSSDDSYAQHVGVSMVSLFENNEEIEEITVFLIENNISIENKKKLDLISRKHNRILKYINFELFRNRLKLQMRFPIAINAYARLFIASALPDTIEKVFYFDCDTIINDNLFGLWNIDITPYLVAGVCDTVGKNTKQRVNMEPDKPYINSGMLLINLKKWREENIENKFIDFIDSFHGDVFHHDQGTINGVLNENVLVIHPKYNVMTPFLTMNRDEILKYYGMIDFYEEDELKEAKEKPVFIHYTPAFVSRPWIKGSLHPLASLYHKYLDQSPWKGTKLFIDKRSRGEKAVAFLYNNLPFNVAYNLTSLLFK